MGKVVVTSVHCKIELILLVCTFSCNLSSDCSCGSVNPAEMCSQVFWKVISWPLKKNLAGDWKRTPGAD